MTQDICLLACWTARTEQCDEARHPARPWQVYRCPRTGEDDDDIQDTEEYVEETLSLDEVEKEMIRKALERHHGKRKSAAKDLNISERTLYRKIKEYELD